MNQEFFLESGNLKIQAQVWGDTGIHPPILALHGLMDNSSSFEPLGRIFSRNYIFAPDLVGHGFSSHLPSHVLYSLETHILIILTLLDQLGWKEFSIVGHSLGAGIGLALAAIFPQRVTHLVMLDTLGPPAQPMEAYLEQFLMNMQSRLVSQNESQAIYRTQEEAIQIRCLMSSSSLEAANLIVARDLKAVSSGFVSRCDRRLQFKSHRSFTEEQWRTLIHAVSCPTLLIKAQSGILTDYDINSRKDYFKDLTIVEVKGGHHAHIETPDIVASHISKFMIKNHYEFSIS